MLNFLRKHTNSLKMDKKIYLVFAIVVLIAVSNAIISAVTIRNSKKIVYNISLITNPTLEKLEEMNLLVTRSRMLVTNWVYLPGNQRDKDSLMTLNYHVYPRVKSALAHLSGKWNSPSGKERMNRLFRDYEDLAVYERKITGTLVTFDDYQDPMKKFTAEELIETEIIPRSNDIMFQLKQLTTEKKAEAALMQDRMIESYYYLLVMVLGLAVIIVVSVVMAGGYMIGKVIVPIMKIREVVLQISKGELPDFNLRFSYNALGEMSYAIRQLINGLRRIAHFAGEIGKGNLNTGFEPLSDKDVFGSALLEMRNRLAAVAESDNARNWKNQGMANLSLLLHKNAQDLQLFCQEIISAIVSYSDAQQGAIYLVDETDGASSIQLAGYYGFHNRMVREQLEMKEGLVGQAISGNSKIYVPRISNADYTVESGLVKAGSCDVFIVPLYTSGKVLGAIEIVSTSELTHVKMALIEEFALPLSANLFSMKANFFTKKLLEASQKQTEALATQKQELRQINDELISQSQLLKLSEEELKRQQEELKNANFELRTKAVLLEEKNLTIEEAQQSIVFKAEQLERSNKFKSAFLANMSHELRTPLNSVLILAKLLADNREKNLNEKQTEYARVIHKSGSDLLLLINDILDLSKIESGKIELNTEEIQLSELLNDLQNLFREFANEKGIHFSVKASADAPLSIQTDRMRLDQVLKNLLSNAFKFTPKEGTVMLEIAPAGSDISFKNQRLFAGEKVISISISDTGIGIPPEKQELIFEAFKQADGSTSRKYGGTGLGLAISKELTQMLGGDLAVSSEEGKGSTFTVHLPVKFIPPVPAETWESLQPSIQAASAEAKTSIRSYEWRVNEIFDDRTNLSPDDIRILIVEDDLAFSKTLIELAHQQDLKVIAAVQGDLGIRDAIAYRPDAIILDMQLPVMDGWMVLQKLKEDDALKEIPVYILSGMDRKKLGIEMGATGYIMKPPNIDEIRDVFKSVINSAKRSIKKVMLVESRKEEMEKILSVLREKEKNSNILAVEDLQSCISNMQIERYDSIMMHAALVAEPANMEMVKVIEAASQLSGTKLRVYEDHEMPGSTSQQIASEVSTPKEAWTVPPPVEQPAPVMNLTPAARPGDQAEFLHGVKVLIADDDMRNIYALISILEIEGAEVICACDGQQALEKLREFPEIRIVLMDVMMPGMDGLEAIAALRKNKEWDAIPVIAITAKAMAGDREKCMASGATDYLSKPIHTELLLDTIRICIDQENK